eukprot:1008977-Pleurochrysis_carterae.AAC.1
MRVCSLCRGESTDRNAFMASAPALNSPFSLRTFNGVGSEHAGLIAKGPLGARELTFPASFRGDMCISWFVILRISLRSMSLRLVGDVRVPCCNWCASLIDITPCIPSVESCSVPCSRSCNASRILDNMREYRGSHLKVLPVSPAPKAQI